MMIKMNKINKLFITILEAKPTVKPLIKKIKVKVMMLKRISLFDQNQVTSIPQTTRQVITLMMKDQNTAGRISKVTLMKLLRQKIKKASTIKFTDGKIAMDAHTKLKIGLI